MISLKGRSFFYYPLCKKIYKREICGQEKVYTFKNKELAFKVSSKLVMFDLISDGLFLKAESEIEKLIEIAEIVLQEQTTNQTGCNSASNIAPR